MKYKILFSKHNFFISLIYIAYKLTFNQTNKFIVIRRYMLDKKLALVAMVTSFKIRKKKWRKPLSLCQAKMLLFNII